MLHVKHNLTQLILDIHVHFVTVNTLLIMKCILGKYACSYVCGLKLAGAHLS